MKTKPSEQQYAPWSEDDEDEDDESMIWTDEQIEAFAKAIKELMGKTADEPAGDR